MPELLDHATDQVSDLSEGAPAVAAAATGAVVGGVEHARANRAALGRLLLGLLVAAVAVVVLRRLTTDDDEERAA